MEQVSSFFEKDNIAFTMKETINNGNEKIRQRRKNKLVKVTAAPNTEASSYIEDAPDTEAVAQSIAEATATGCNLNYMVSECVMRHNAVSTDIVIATSHVAFDDDDKNTEEPPPQRCEGEKKKGGRCSRKAKKGKYCETHASERREIERRLEGGVYVYRSKETMYDIEEILRKGVGV